MKTQTKIAFLILLLVATACASRKKMVMPPKPFMWLTANMSIDAEGNGLTYNDLNGQLRMRRDSLVWLNVTAMLGVEVLRAKITTDSIWVINRWDKTYLAEPLDSISALLGMPVSLPVVQSLLFDNNQGLPPHENQTVWLKGFIMGNLSAKIKYNNVKLDEKTTFPMRITDKMERIRFTKKGV